MSQTKVIKQFTKFIFPLVFDQKRVKVRSNTNNGQELFTRISIKGEYLRDGLGELLDMNGGATKIADCYQLNANCRRDFDLPNHSNNCLQFFCRNDKKTSYDVCINDIRIHLFESGVGFFEIECLFDKCDIDSFTHLNYFISEAKSEGNYFKWIEERRLKEPSLTEEKEHTFSVKELLDKINKSISINDSDVACKIEYYKSKPVIYSYLLLSDIPDNLDEVVFHVTKNYKDSYKFSGEATVSKLQPFMNSYWSSSTNGVVNISCLTGDNVTDLFFQNQFGIKLRDTYFLLFINALHQKQALELMLSKMGQLDSLVNDYEIMNEQLKKADSYEAEAHNLKFRSFFNHPSTVEHINDYYNMLKKTFSIDALYSNFISDLGNLQDICKKYVSRITARDGKFARIRMIKSEIFVAIFGTLVGEFSLLNTSWELIERFAGREVSFFAPQMLLVIATLLVPVVTIYFSVKKLIIEINQLKKELKEELEADLVENDKLRRKKAKLKNKIKRNNL